MKRGSVSGGGPAAAYGAAGYERGCPRQDPFWTDWHPDDIISSARRPLRLQPGKKGNG